MTKQDRSLSDLATDEPRDVSLGDVDSAEDFDIESWIQGGRPTRRAVTLNLRGDLVGRLEEIVALLEDEPDDDTANALIEEAEQVQADLRAARRIFVIEGRSQEWVENFRTETAKTRGLKIGDRSGRAEDRITILLLQIVDQIATPSGVTLDHLRRIMRTSEPELNKLLVAMQMANSQAAEAASVVGVDFSQRRSGVTAG